MSTGSSRSPVPAASARRASSIELGRCSRPSSWTASRSCVGRRHRAGGLPPGPRGGAGRQGGGGAHARRRDRRAHRRQEGAPAPGQPRAGRGGRPDVAGLVERCPALRIVTTSRTPLRIAAEREYPRLAVRSTRRRLGCRAVRRAREDDQRLLRADGRERRGRRGHLPAPGRPAAGARARCRPASAPLAGSAARAARPRARRAHLGRRATCPSGSRRCAQRSTGATRC